MEVILCKPKNDLLKQYIECFYILKHSKKKGKTSYISFPNVYSMVSVLANAENKISKNEIYTKHDSKTPFYSNLYDSFQKPIKVNFEGEIKEITIYFKPLGLNVFLEQPLSTYSRDPFIPYADFEDCLFKILLQLDNEEDSISRLERYLVSKHCGFEHPFLPSALDLILNKKQQSIIDIASDLGVSHKTLIKHFQEHCNRTPSEFKKIIRFFVMRSIRKHKIKTLKNLQK